MVVMLHPHSPCPVWTILQAPHPFSTARWRRCLHLTIDTTACHAQLPDKVWHVLNRNLIHVRLPSRNLAPVPRVAPSTVVCRMTPLPELGVHHHRMCARLPPCNVLLLLPACCLLTSWLFMMIAAWLRWILTARRQSRARLITRCTLHPMHVCTSLPVQAFISHLRAIWFSLGPWEDPERQFKQARHQMDPADSLFLLSETLLTTSALHMAMITPCSSKIIGTAVPHGLYPLS